MDVSRPAVEIESLLKLYHGRPVVQDLSFQIRRGELFALLGPNGAGKSTTVEIVEGYRRPDGGRVSVFGLDPIRDGARLKPRIGLMLQQGGAFGLAHPLEMLKLYASFYVDPRNPAQLLEQVGLEEATRTRVRQLSGGQQQRLALALALIGRPELLILDEPTAGMDPRARQATWNLVLAEKERGTTILLTTHYLEEAERLADRVAIIDRGRLIALDAPLSLIRSAAGAASLISFRTRPGLPTGALSERLDAAPVEEREPGQYTVSVEPTPLLLATLTGFLAEQDALLSELSTGSQSLEDVFLRLTGRGLRE